MAIPAVREPLKSFQLPAYAFLISTIVFQIGDMVLAVMPFRPGAVIWRFQTLNLLASQGGNLLLLLLMLQLVAILLGDRRMLAALLGANIFFVVVLAIALVAFGLDTLQIRAKVDPQVVSKFDLTAMQAISKYLLQGAIAVLFAISARRSYLALTREFARADRVSEDYLVIRTADRVT
jgi:hypothetical protein